jgi:hypothetical protein
LLERKGIMPTFEVKQIINGQPCFEKPLPEILAELKVGGAIKTMSPLEHITDRQRRWYKGPCLQGLSDWNGDTREEWDLRLKAVCGGNELLKSETIYLGNGNTCKRLTIVGAGKRNMTAYIENILSKSIEMDWPVDPPDPELRDF